MTPYVPRGRTDGCDDAKSHFSQFCEGAQKGESSEGWYPKRRSSAKLSTTPRCHVSGGVAPCSLNLSTRCRKVVNFTPRPVYHRTKSSRRLINRRLCAPCLLWMFRRQQKPPGPAGNRNRISHPSSPQPIDYTDWATPALKQAPFLSKISIGTPTLLTFMWISSVTPDKCQGSLKTESQPLPSTHLTIRRSLIIISFDAIIKSWRQRR